MNYEINYFLPQQGFLKGQKMTHINRSKKTLELACLLKRINGGEDPKILRKEAFQLANKVNPSDIVAAEQILIDEGCSSHVAQQLTATFVLMGLYRKDENTKSNLPYDHILRKIKIEHELARCFLADLNNVAETILGLDYLTDVSSEFRKLSHIILHLAVMKEHIDREENVIFLFLVKHGWPGLCRAAQTDHSKIRNDIDNLVELTTSINTIRFEDFKAWLIPISKRLSTTMEEHFLYEDDLFYPISLVVIDDVVVWKAIKELCDEIGYCGAHG
jgi:DUF438 domain-containing protein